MDRALTDDDQGPAPRARWLVLAGYSLLVACTQLLWLSFAPVTAQAHHALGVSEGAIGDLAGINPLMYVLLALPAGRWLDRRFGHALAAGALLTAGGALLRLADTGSYAWILAGQVVISAGQPLVVNSTTKVAARYFPAAERTTAISVASAAQFCGILAAALTGGPLEQAGGLRLLLGVQAGLTVAAAACVLAAVRVPAAFAGDSPIAISLGWLRRDRVMWLLAGLLFVGVGVFNAIATWLDSILTHFGEGGASGPLIALTTAAGIAGAAVLPGAVARRNRRRALLLTATAMTAVVFGAMTAVHNVVFIGFALALEGFVLLAGLPVSLDWSELHAGPRRAGTAAGFLLLAGNLGGTVSVLIIQALIGNPYLSLAAIAVFALPGLALAARLPARPFYPERTAARPPADAHVTRGAGDDDHHSGCISELRKVVMWSVGAPPNRGEHDGDERAADRAVIPRVRGVHRDGGARVRASGQDRRAWRRGVRAEP